MNAIWIWWAFIMLFGIDMLPLEAYLSAIPILALFLWYKFKTDKQND